MVLSLQCTASAEHRSWAEHTAAGASMGRLQTDARLRGLSERRAISYRTARACHSCTLRTCGGALPLWAQASSDETAAIAADSVVKYGTFASSALRRIA